jgi:D-aminoacyl-tRNA deacylase
MIVRLAAPSTDYGIPTRSDQRSDVRSENPIDRVTIVSSTVDPASKNITQHLVSEHGFRPSDLKGSFDHPNGNIRIVTVEKPGIYVEPSDIQSNGSSIIFASRHVSSANKPAMTVHATGNLTRNAEFGGNPEEVAFVDPAMIRGALRGLRERVAYMALEIEVTMEATHHGPTSFKAPVCFVEIGSTPKEWTDPALGRIAAGAIMDAATTEHHGGKSVVAFGGTHYSAKFTRICLEGDYAIGHVVPKHAFESGVTDTVIRDTFEKTVAHCDTALVDWKGLNGDNRRVLVAKLETWGCSAVRC